MRSIMRIAMLGMGACLFLGVARAADASSTADVLNKLHNWNLTAIEAGKLAQDNGRSQATKDYGKMLVTDQKAADQQVAALAAEEKIDISAATPVVGARSVADLVPGFTFDRRFARSMVEDHKKVIAELTAARDQTTDPKLKKLLTDLLPTLQKHESLAEALERGK